MTTVTIPLEQFEELVSGVTQIMLRINMMAADIEAIKEATKVPVSIEKDDTIAALTPYHPGVATAKVHSAILRAAPIVKVTMS